ANIEIISNFSRLIVIDTDKKIDLSGCAMITEASRFLSDIDYIDSIDFAPYKNIPINVRVIRYDSAKDIDVMKTERRIGHLFYTKGAKIDLDRPEKRIRLYLGSQESYAGELVFSSSKEFAKRKASLRPFHMPVSLDPKIAHTMINLAGAKAGDSILDPFAGTGGILIEAGFLKCRIFGIDIDKKMVAGTITNLKHYGITSYMIKEGDAFDARQMFGESFDAIVTDFPYGKNTKDADVRNIAEKFLEYAPALIKKGRYIVAASNLKNLTIPDTLKLENLFEIYIHKSMSKWIYVLKI
ncbi:MAG: methyltransferase domain-containing protein, partial [archaeon]|nr:methyltransferase domain-containing protein [archaeon]